MRDEDQTEEKVLTAQEQQPEPEEFDEDEWLERAWKAPRGI